MPDLEILIGGRGFQVSCQPGEEHFLHAAARMLDAEAQPIMAQLGRLPEARMLLMAGLMLADRTAALEDEVQAMKAQVAALEARQARAAVELPVIPASVTETLAEIAARAEALAAALEERAGA
jgi:cell division protein ZapA